MDRNTQWICSQIGARENYAVPRSLHSRSALELLITDFWLRPDSVFSRLSPTGNLQGRFHSELADAEVDCANLSALTFELVSRMRGQSGWDQIMARNNRFQVQTVKRLRRIKEDGKNRTVFAYSYAAKEAFRYARERGWRTILGQIDPGPVHERIVVQEAARAPQLATGWKPAPADYWILWRQECELADYIIVNSEWSLQLLKQAGIAERKVRLVPLAFEPSRNGERPAKIYPKQFTSERPLRVLFLGQINLGKGIARLLNAATILQGEAIEFWMVGSNQMGDIDLGIGANLRWFGPVTRETTAKYYHGADVFILPTLSDGFGLTQLEALAQRVPVIVSRCCGSVVRHEVDGLVLLEPTTEAIVDSLRFCLSYPAKLASFSREASVGERFSLQSLGRDLMALE